MYVILNSLKNLGRNKGRNLLIGIIILLIIATSGVAIVINTTAGAIIDDYKTRFGAVVRLEMDFENISYGGDGNTPDIGTITNDQYFKFGQSEYLQKSEYDVSMSVSPNGLKALDEDAEKSEQSERAKQGASSGHGEEIINPTMRIIARNRADISDDFKNKKRNIIDGQAFANKDECIISKDFAELNSLKVGDTLKVSGVFQNNPMTHTLKVTGIYEDFTMVGENRMFIGALSHRGNEIITNIDTIVGMEMYEDQGIVQAKYYLKNPDMLANFTKELQSLGLPNSFNVKTDESGYKTVVGPVEGLKKVTTAFMVIVLILGAVILIFLSAIAIRERKYEIGVLRAMGMKKSKVMIGFVAEMIALTCICLVVGFGVATATAQPVADSMLQGQIELAEEAKSEAKNGPGGVGIFTLDGSESSELTPLSELEVGLTLQSSLQMIAIALLLALFASIVGVLTITRYEPITILTERN